MVIRGCIAEDVESHAVGEFYGVELGFLGDDIVDVGFEERVCFEDFGANASCDGGFDFGFGGCGEAGGERLVSVNVAGRTQ